VHLEIDLGGRFPAWALDEDAPATPAWLAGVGDRSPWSRDAPDH